MAATFGSIATGSSGTGVRTPQIPANVQTGDLSMVWEGISNNAARAAGDVTGGNGTWFNELTSLHGNGSIYVDGKICTSDDAQPPNTYSVQGATIQNTIAIALRFDGIDTADPFGASNLNATASATSAAVSLTGGSAPLAGSALVWAFKCQSTTVSCTTPPSGFTLRTGAGVQSFHIATLNNWAGGDTSSLTATMSGSSTHRTMLIAINPMPAFSGPATTLTETITLSSDGVKGLLGGGSETETVTLSSAGFAGISGAATPPVETVTLTGSGATGVEDGASPLTETVSMESLGEVAAALDGDLVETVTLTSAGLSGYGGTAARTVTVTGTATVAPGSNAAQAATISLTAGGAVAALAGGTLAITAEPTMVGSADKYKGGSLAVTAEGSAGGEIRRYFTPPTQEQAMDDLFWGRFQVPVGISVIRIDGHYTNVPTPTDDELVTHGVEGTDWFRGGYTYEVSEDVELALIADGYAPVLLSGYGFGPYGLTPYGGS